MKATRRGNVKARGGHERKAEKMGDKGGKKDKEKGQKQNASKQKNLAQIKKDKRPKGKP